MDKSTAGTQIQSTTDYKKFTFIDTNREVNRGHVEALKRAFEEVGNLTAVQPILVNEKFQIIDGQHRFVAASELGAPVFYTQQQGLTVNDARSMNVLQKGWNVDDYAQSYAKSGHRPYQVYMKLREDFGYTHSIILAYSAVNGAFKGGFAEFKRGEFEIEDEALTRDRLNKLEEIADIMPVVYGSRDFAYAFLKVLVNENYDHERMVEKARSAGATMRLYGSVTEYLRALEDMYNLHYSENNRTRLY